MRRRARTDRNQREIVHALRKAGLKVQDLSGVHDGCPDLFVGRAGVWYAIEIKDGEKAPSKRRLTPAQVRWMADAEARNAGPVVVVTNAVEALEALGFKPEGARLAGGER